MGERHDRRQADGRAHDRVPGRSRPDDGRRGQIPAAPDRGAIAGRSRGNGKPTTTASDKAHYPTLIRYGHPKPRPDRTATDAPVRPDARGDGGAAHCRSGGLPGLSRAMELNLPALRRLMGDDYVLWGRTTHCKVSARWEVGPPLPRQGPVFWSRQHQRIGCRTKNDWRSPQRHRLAKSRNTATKMRMSMYDLLRISALTIRQGNSTHGQHRDPALSGIEMTVLPVSPKPGASLTVESGS